MDNVNSIFTALKNVLLDKMSPIGFLLGNENYHPESFGSRFVEFQNKNQVFQLVWDGKDGWFILKYCGDILVYPFPEWKEITVQPFDVHQSNKTAEELVKIIEESLEAFISEFIE